MSMSEALQWMEYVRRRGGLNVTRRLEMGFAQIMLMIARYMGDKKSSLDDFMPHERDHIGDDVYRSEPISSPEALAALLNSTIASRESGKLE